MAVAYNWARMSDSSIENAFSDNRAVIDSGNGKILDNLKKVYESIWEACLGTTEGFQKFFEQCQTGFTDEAKTKPVDGDTFMKEVKSRFKGEFTGKEFLSRIDKHLETHPELESSIKRALKMVAVQYNRTGREVNKNHSADTHIAAGYLMGVGLHLQQGCGQGKSSAVATATLMNRGYGEKAEKQMFVTSSTPELADQTFKDIAGYFEDLEIGGQSQERLFLMTPNGPKVTVRNREGQMLTQNTDPEQKRYIMLDDKTVRIAEQKEEINSETGKKEKVWEEGATKYEDLKTEAQKANAYEIVKNAPYKKGFEENGATKTEEAHFVVEGGKVRLANRGVESKSPNYMGWERGAKPYSELTEPEKKQALQIIYGDKENVIIADNATIVQDNMKGAIPSKDPSERHVIMDEGDYVKNDQYQYLQQKGAQYSLEEQAHRNKKRSIARNVIEKLMVSGKLPENLYEGNINTQFVQFTTDGVSKVREIWKKVGNTETLTSEMMHYIEEALVAEIAYLPNVDYVVEGNKIISQHKASGTKIDLPEGIAQALAMKEGKEIPTEYRVFNIQTITGAYQEIFGDNQTRASGTHEAETLEGAVVVANRQVAGKRNDDAIKEQTTYEGKIDKTFQNTRYRTLLDNGNQVDQVILLETKAMIQQGRPVLIGCVTSNDVHEMHAKLKGVKLENGQKPPVPNIVEMVNGNRVITYTAEAAEQYSEDIKEVKDGGLSPDEFEAKYTIAKSDAPAGLDGFVKKFGGKKNTIVLGTSIVGRGANIKIDDEMNNIGGLHVITRGIHPSSVRQMVQFINRSMRGEQNGSSHDLFSVDDLQSAKPQIQARKEDVLERLKNLENLKEGEEQKLHEELKELEKSLEVLNKLDNRAKTPKSFNSTEDVFELLNDEKRTIQIDNDGRHIDENGNVISSRDEQNLGEMGYRGFYSIADTRNRLLGEKARGIEKAVSEKIASLKRYVLKLPCSQEIKMDMALNIVPEFVGRVLAVQYRVNGNTSDEIAKNCEAEVSFLLGMYSNKCYLVSKGEVFKEDDYIKGKQHIKGSERVFRLTKEESETYKENNKEAGEEVAKEVVVRGLTKEELSATYSEISGEAQVDREIKPEELLDVIMSSGLSLEDIKKKIQEMKAQNAEKARQNTESARQNS